MATSVASATLLSALMRRGGLENLRPTRPELHLTSSAQTKSAQGAIIEAAWLVGCSRFLPVDHRSALCSVFVHIVRKEYL